MSEPTERVLAGRAIDAMAASLPQLRRLAVHMRAAWGDTPEVRITEALRFSIATLLTSYAVPGSEQMAAADVAIAELSPEPPHGDPES